MRAAVRAELLHCGIEALGMESVDDVAGALAEGRSPAAIVLDASGEGAPLPAQANPATRASLVNLAKRVPMVVVASGIEPAPALEGAAALLHRPVSVGEIVSRVKQLLEGRAA